ncbi:uncharacterized protein [Triticum aestivum]|uniref:uncharacterized protein n=1 Tax=Triticum aestivum TaxID=4565 RepID=UPI001D01B637|nr:uncharacterized protein LOC123156587 [Triticum aestivum]
MTASASLEREQRAINRRNGRESSFASSGSHVPKATNGRMSKGMKAMLKLHAVQAAYAAAEEKRCALEEEQFGRLPDRDGSASSFEERQFGYLVGRGQEYYRTCTNTTRDLSSIVVSIALFDGDEMLFACSGMCITRVNSISADKICDFGVFGYRI